MNRSVFIVVAACVLLLLLAGVLRLTGDVSNEEMLVERQHHPVTGSDDRDGARGPGAVTRTDREARRQRGASTPVVAERHRTLREGGARSARAGSARAGAGQPERHGGAGPGGRGSTGLVGDDSSFRAAADRLSDLEPSRPTTDDEDGAANVVAHEPPATPMVDDSMTYNSGDYRFSLDSPFQIPNTSVAGTVALWLQPEWSPDNEDDAALIELGEGLFRVYKNANVLRFDVRGDGSEQNASVSIADWQPGEWHSLSATWQNQEVTFYVDGQPVRPPIRGNFAVEGQVPLTIGAVYPPDKAVAPGTVSDVSLRSRALAPGEITGLFDRSAFTKRSP